MKKEPRVEFRKKEKKKETFVRSGKRVPRVL